MFVVKGIGFWSVDIFLMNVIGYLDVFFVGDVGLMEVYKCFVDLDERLVVKVFFKYVEIWCFYCVVVVYLFYDWYNFI